jgi:hypothetical protein
VARLERILTEQEGVTVEVSKRLFDRETQEPREHDVVITRRDAHHVIVTALECKDWARPVDAPVIDAFVTKCEATGVHERIIVSASGFTKGARSKAQTRNIVCMELSDAASLDWMANNIIIHVGRTLEHTHADVFFVDDVAPPLPFTVFTAGGDEMTPQHFDGMGLEALQTQFPNDSGNGLRRVLVKTPGWYALGSDGNRYPIANIGLELTVRFGRTTGRFDLHTYKGPNAEYGIASTDVRVGPFSGKIVMIQDGDGTRVVWSPA